MCYLHVSGVVAMPFGVVGAVYAWDRLGSAITAILFDLLLVPCIRYVDDLFWVTHQLAGGSTMFVILVVSS